jgi:hypothetical protein
MNVYTVRFSDKEFVAYNLRDFARIAVFGKWYLRSQSSTDSLKCSMQQQEAPSLRNVISINEAEAAAMRSQRAYPRQRTSEVRKALRTFFYNFLW